jgi:hypothetical protein
METSIHGCDAAWSSTGYNRTAKTPTCTRVHSEQLRSLVGDVYLHHTAIVSALAASYSLFFLQPLHRGPKALQ